MPVHLEFDDAWLHDYYAKLGKFVPPELAEKNGEKAKKPRKYRNIPTEVDGKKYPSRREANRHVEIDRMWRAGEIAAYAEQVRYRLPGGIIYIADFVLLYCDGMYCVEDAKGVRTKEYKLKKRLMEEVLGIKICEV